MYKLSFPIFISTVIWQKISGKAGVNSITINGNFGLSKVDELGGGSLEIRD
jgi:hypothetical protein